jgi:tetratricopeptide (TPR) repeat protein
VELVFHYFGGNRLEGRVYTLRKTKGTWLVHHLRRWVLHEAMGPDIRTFDALYFKHADEDAKEALENEALDLHDRLTKLVRAKWIPSAFKLAQKSTQATPKSASAWSALGALAFEMGELSISRKAIQKALKIDPEFGVPTLLKP